MGLDHKCLLMILCLITSVTIVLFNLGTDRFGINNVSGLPPLKEIRNITAPLRGRLGNWMWIYASLYGVARKTHRKPFLCKEGNHIKELFPYTSIEVYNNQHCNQIQNVKPNDNLVLSEGGKLHAWTYQRELIPRAKSSTKSLVISSGYRQNVNYFLDYEEEIKKEFVLRKGLQDYAQEYLHGLAKTVTVAMKGNFSINSKGIASLDGKPFVFINVHVRGNGYFNMPFLQPSNVYYNHAMDYFRKKYGSNVVFSVGTDDQKWAQLIIQAQDAYFTRQQSRDNDLAIGIACNHTILDLSTFAWWMAFLGPGEVVYFNYLGKQQRKYQGTYWLNKWTPINVDAYADQTFQKQVRSAMPHPNSLTSRKPTVIAKH